MEDRKLIVELKMRGERETQVIGLARIQVDGHGALLLYHTTRAVPAKISINELQSFAIRQGAHLMGTAA
jgi:hypothetical protein